MLVLLAMMLTGTFVYKKKWLGEEGCANISKLVVNVFNPLLVIGGVLGDTDAISQEKILENLQLVLLYYVIAVVFGILLAFGMIFPNMPMYIIPIPFPIKAKYMVLGYGALELLFGISGAMSSVAHFAHLGGMLFGFIIIWYWKKNGIIRRNGIY